jgi:hypothetical protein
MPRVRMCSVRLSRPARISGTSVIAERGQLRRYAPERRFMMRLIMSKPAALNSSQVTAETPAANRDLRWPRIVASSLWMVIWFGLGSLASDLIGSVWNHNFTTSVLSAQVFLWFGKALAIGLFLGLMTGSSTWLAQELFGRPKTNSSQ